MPNVLRNIFDYLRRHTYSILLGVLFCIFIWIRFSGIYIWGDLQWDQVHSAWMSARILHDHEYPLQSMMVKGNSGIHIGPLYYYLVALFYWMTNYDPIASPLMAASTGVLGFIVLYWCVRNIHGDLAAFLAVFFLTFSGASILADRVQWSPNLIPPISALLFYNLYRVIQGKSQNFLWIGVLIGVSFHVHFIVFLFIGMVLLAIPLFPRTKRSLLYATLAIIIVLVSMAPNIAYEYSHPNNAALDAASNYATSTYHGFHFRRFIQLTRDAFIDVEKILPFRFIGRGIYLLPFIYMYCVWYFIRRKDSRILSFIVGIWLLVPWIAFTVYNGEISDYYFSSFRYIAILMIAYVLSIMISKSFYSRLIAIAFLFYFVTNSWNLYTNPAYGNLNATTQLIKHSVTNGKEVPFVEGSLKSYLYYMYTELNPVSNK